jgi:SAM-dependent methyltransferase
MKRFAWIPEPVRGFVRKGAVSYRSKQEQRNSLRLLKSLDLRLSHGREYECYLLDQVTRSWGVRSQIDAGNRAENLINMLRKSDQRSGKGRSVLCVGCRNSHELNIFRKAGFENVIGIDLFSIDEAILQMDMHAMSFPDNHFDVVFSCHSLEHSYDPIRALSEFARVVKDGGVCTIELPVRFTPTSADLQDFGSLQALQSACEPFLGQILFAEESQDSKSGIARLAFITRKGRNGGQSN